MRSLTRKPLLPLGRAYGRKVDLTFPSAPTWIKHVSKKVSYFNVKDIITRTQNDSFFFNWHLQHRIGLLLYWILCWRQFLIRSEEGSNWCWWRVKRLRLRRLFSLFAFQKYNFPSSSSGSHALHSGLHWRGLWLWWWEGLCTRHKTDRKDDQQVNWELW